MKKFSKYLIAIAISLLLVSCATIVSNKRYPVMITSQPTGAKFKVKNAQTGYVITAGETPNTVILEAGSSYMNKARYKLEVSKQGYKTTSRDVIAELDNWYLLGNLIWGNVIGWFMVDPATGAMWELPPYINVKLTK